jgi:hypothetical protein
MHKYGHSPRRFGEEHCRKGNTGLPTGTDAVNLYPNRLLWQHAMRGA